VTAPDDMQIIAQEVANGLASSVDGVFVFCYRAGGDLCGGAIHSPNVPLDSMIGMVVHILGKLREEQAEALKVTS
jgi:hypothetical protein